MGQQHDGRPCVIWLWFTEVGLQKLWMPCGQTHNHPTQGPWIQCSKQTRNFCQNVSFVGKFSLLLLQTLPPFEWQKYIFKNCAQKIL